MSFSIFPKRNYSRRYPKDYGFIRTLYITWFLYFIVWPVSWLFYRLKIKGRENLDKKKRYLYTANHQSYIDPPLISTVANKPVAYMAKSELYTAKSALIRFLVISLGSFGVNREKSERATLETVVDITKKTKWSLGIFPQGTQIKGATKFGDVKDGFIKIAKLAKMDIVPIAICNFKGYNIIPFRDNVTLKVGKPIPYTLPADEILSQWITWMEENIEQVQE